MKLTVYITFENNTKEAMTFYQEVFQGKEPPSFMTYAESPMKDQVPEDFQDKILHSSLNISPEVGIMASDYNPAFSKDPLAPGNNIQIALNLTCKEETDRLFAALSKDGKADGPPADQFWGSYFGHCTDKFGIRWMLDCVLPSKDGKAEIQRAVTSLREAAAAANESAAALEKLTEEPPSKKQKTEE